MAKQLFKDQNMSTLQDISEVDTSAAQTLISTMKALPFEYIIGAPLMACVKAQQASAQVAWDAIREIGFEPDEIGSDRSQEVSMVSFIFQHGGFSRKIRVPLLTLVPIPYMQIDSVDLKFRADMSATSEGQLTAKYSNTMDSQAARNSKYNVTNEIDINIHATTSGMPAGLAKILEIFSSSIDVSDFNPVDYSEEIIEAAKREAELIKAEARAEAERRVQEIVEKVKGAADNN